MRQVSKRELLKMTSGSGKNTKLQFTKILFYERAKAKSTVAYKEITKKTGGMFENWNEWHLFDSQVLRISADSLNKTFDSARETSTNLWSVYRR